MATVSRATLESLLCRKQLDRTLIDALPHPDREARRDDAAIAPTGVSALDECLLGGFPRGELSELVGPRSSGRSSLLLHMIAAATARGELVALVDALDMFDVASAADAGIDLERMLWIRGHVVPSPGLCHDLNQRALEQAVRAFTLVLQAGNFGLVALDVADAPADAIRRLPFTTWLRLQRMVEGSQTACVLAGSDPMARSSAGLTLKFGGAQPGLSGAASLRQRVRFGPRVFRGLETEARVVRARTRVNEEASVAFTTVAHHGAA